MYFTPVKVAPGLFQDWENNKGNFKSRLIMVFYRSAAFINRHPVLRYLFFWYLLFYKLFIGWIINIGIDLKAEIGKGLRIQHGYGTVIGADTILGKNCNLRQLTTISNKIQENGLYSASPVIGDNVDIGVNVTIIGDIKIGNNVVIGAGSVITKDVEDNCIVVGNPAFLLKKIYSFPYELDPLTEI